MQLMVPDLVSCCATHTECAVLDLVGCYSSRTGSPVLTYGMLLPVALWSSFNPKRRERQVLRDVPYR
eukprot:117215-Rhodomonas_salina.1